MPSRVIIIKSIRKISDNIFTYNEKMYNVRNKTKPEKYIFQEETEWALLK